MEIERLLKQILSTPQDISLRDSFFKELERRNIKPVSNKERVYDQINQHFLQKGIQIRYLEASQFSNHFFFSSEGSFRITLNPEDHFNLENIDLHNLTFCPWSGKLKGWEKTLDIDFSKYEEIDLTTNHITEDIIENYISKWNLTSCTILRLQNNFRISKRGFDIVLQMNLPALKFISLDDYSEITKIWQAFPTLTTLRLNDKNIKRP